MVSCSFCEVGPRLLPPEAGRVVGHAVGARIGGARNEIFVDGELLADQARAVDRAVLAHNQAAVGLVVEQRLPDAEHDERINAAADDGEHHRDHHGAADFR